MKANEMMITEDYCSYEVAKLLKKKGLDELCGAIYIILPNGDYRWSKIDYPHKNSVDTKPVAIMCPTHQMAMKWLREVKDIDIVIMPLFRFKGGKIYCYEIHSDDIDVREGRFDTYEQAVEAAIKYCLENLI